MAGFHATVYFFGEGISRHYDQEVADDAALRRSLDLAEGGNGGLIVASDSARLLIEDDLDHVIDSLLVRLPEELRAGRDMLFEYHYGPEGVRITQSAGEVTFDNFGGDQVSAPLADVLSGLDAARDRYRALMTLVAKDGGAA